MSSSFVSQSSVGRRWAFLIPSGLALFQALHVLGVLSIQPANEKEQSLHLGGFSRPDSEVAPPHFHCPEFNQVATTNCTWGLGNVVWLYAQKKSTHRHLWVLEVSSENSKYHGASSHFCPEFIKGTWTLDTYNVQYLYYNILNIFYFEVTAISMLADRGGKEGDGASFK